MSSSKLFVLTIGFRMAEKESPRHYENSAAALGWNNEIALKLPLGCGICHFLLLTRSKEANVQLLLRNEEVSGTLIAIIL
jgi:hypothetical protein